MTPHSDKSKASATVLGSFFLLLAGLTWASLAEIDQVSRASGQLIPQGRVQVVQSVDGGTITGIFVTDGQSVTRGQVLMELDPRQLQAVVDDSEAKVAALEISNSRIEAELFDRPMTVPSHLVSYVAFIDNQTQLYDRRRQSQTSALKSLEHTLRIAQDQFDLKKTLATQNLVTKSELLQQEQALAEAEAALLARKDRYFEELQAEFVSNTEDLAAARQVLVQRQAAAENLRIVAPVDGIIKHINFTTLGGVLRPGDEVMQIVPETSILIVEARLPPSEIGHVQIGQNASIKFDAFDSGIFGAAAGRVTYISPDTLKDARGGVEMAFYVVHLDVSLTTMKNDPDRPLVLHPGMTATVEIRGGRNTVLNYLLKPVTKTLSNSFGER